MTERLPMCYGKSGQHPPTEMESTETDHHPSQVECPVCGTVIDAFGYTGERDTDA